MLGGGGGGRYGHYGSLPAVVDASRGATPAIRGSYVRHLPRVACGAHCEALALFSVARETDAVLIACARLLCSCMLYVKLRCFASDGRACVYKYTVGTRTRHGWRQFFRERGARVMVNCMGGAGALRVGHVFLRCSHLWCCALALLYAVSVVRLVLSVPAVRSKAGVCAL